MRTIFHIATSADWEKALSTGQYTTESLNTEGFIHTSRPHQVEGVAQRYFQGQKDLWLLEINQEKVLSEIKYEPSKDEHFPHIYGPLNLDAILSYHKIAITNDKFPWPPTFRYHNEALIRRAVPSDAAEIANVHIHAWQESYQNLISESYLKKLPLSFRRRMRHWQITMTENQQNVFVVESKDHGVVGFCSIQKSSEQDMPDWGELTTIYLLEAFKKQGYGYRLWDLAFQELRSQGYKKAFCWVLKGNPTIDFYTRTGAIKNKRTKENYIDQEVTEYCMEWSLRS